MVGNGGGGLTLNANGREQLKVGEGASGRRRVDRGVGKFCI